MNRHMNWAAGVCVVCLALVLVAAPGCKGKKDVQITPSLTSDRPGVQTTEETTTGEGLPGLDAERLESLLFDKASGLKPIYFDFDRYSLRPDARDTLKENAEKIKQAPNVFVQIEGHCDERGTQEYNFALGESRALAARQYLIKLGVSGDRLITISYGEEAPADPGHDEAAWAKNRRCEFNKAL